MNRVLYKDEVYAIQGAVFDVYREVGCGFLEAVYQECLERELTYREVPFVSQQTLTLNYKGDPLKQTYKPDFICHGKIILEIKAVTELDEIHRAQAFNYLKATGMRLALLVNFGSYPQADVQRIIK